MTWAPHAAREEGARKPERPTGVYPATSDGQSTFCPNFRGTEHRCFFFPRILSHKVNAVLTATLKGMERCSNQCGHGRGLQTAATWRNYIHKHQRVGHVLSVHSYPRANLMLRYNTSFWLNRIIKPWFFPCPSSSLWDCIDGSFLYITTLTQGLLNRTGTPRHRRCCARPMARVAHAARRLSHSSAGTQAQPPKSAAPCYGGKFLWVSIIHPKCLTRFSYKCGFTMISEFGTGMSDTCYFRLSARAEEKNSLFHLLVYKPV